jgi:transcriptional regulator NrdR family protein
MPRRKDSAVSCKCGGLTKVTDSRPAHVGTYTVRRRRECLTCGHRWTTYEITAEELSQALRGVISDAEAFLEATRERTRRMMNYLPKEEEPTNAE